MQKKNKMFCRIRKILRIYTLSLIIFQTYGLNESPNIIVFVGDDLGWDDVGFHGSKQMRTPNIDTLASDGIILNNYYTSPVCSPSRGALLSGVHPIHSGTQNYVILTPSPWGLPLNLKLMPQYFKDYNYATHAVG
jgi:arylsulfatase A-like enzyme